ncbi:phage integrase SAM-like domain-containing protein [Flavobacteriaceae bacterium]|nr:phage integrase SAM-like domain-containing protein [Flavobacteriaceae bacterium]
MRFALSKPLAEITTIRIEIDLPGIKSPLKYSTGRSIKPEHWDKKKYRAKTMRGAQGDRNRKLNLILNEYEFAVVRIRDLYGAALTKDKLKSKLDEYFHIDVKKPETVLELFDEYIDEIVNLGTLTKRTIEKYKMTGKKWLEFQGKRKIMLHEINYSVLINYVTFLRDRYKLTDNTLHRNINFLKTFLIWNQRNGRKVSDDYKKIKIN